MPTADATLLPPVPKDPDSGKSLDSVGPLAVLATMVEQKKRASQPAPEEIEDPLPEEGEEAKKRAKVSHSYIKVR